jgi:DNA-binding response OmpR family regulator
MGDPTGYVLVVEDDRSIRELICETLRAASFETVEAADGEEAVKAARDRRPAVVVLDLGLPRLDGCGVADQIRDQYDHSVPIIVVTAGGKAGDVSRVRAAVTFTKPFDIDDLIGAVQQVVAPPAGAPEKATPLPAEN